MNCVTCEKCRLWGKLQILGFGTAIKILLTPDEDLSVISSPSGGVEEALARQQCSKILNRQEVIALVNTLNQLSNSVAFAAHAARLRHEQLLLEAERESFQQQLLRLEAAAKLSSEGNRTVDE